MHVSTGAYWIIKTSQYSLSRSSLDQTTFYYLVIINEQRPNISGLQTPGDRKTVPGRNLCHNWHSWWRGGETATFNKHSRGQRQKINHSTRYGQIYLGSQKLNRRTTAWSNTDVLTASLSSQIRVIVVVAVGVGGGSNSWPTVKYPNTGTEECSVHHLSEQTGVCCSRQLWKQ